MDESERAFDYWLWIVALQDNALQRARDVSDALLVYELRRLMELCQSIISVIERTGYEPDRFADHPSYLEQYSARARGLEQAIKRLEKDGE